MFISWSMRCSFVPLTQNSILKYYVLWQLIRLIFLRPCPSSRPFVEMAKEIALVASSIFGPLLVFVITYVAIPALAFRFIIRVFVIGITIVGNISVIPAFVVPAIALFPSYLFYLRIFFVLRLIFLLFFVFLFFMHLFGFMVLFLGSLENIVWMLKMRQMSTKTDEKQQSWVPTQMSDNTDE